ncbi:MAG: hypothetical protein B7X31_01040 [Thiomonas sp. 13-66-29]|jgi:hypothetical protein|uniref:Uncharacterized protein n=1 Tax=Thiomonas delicata TaxID=364030 RepID=A0A238D5S9_THIDL|nr:hypothetical protein [Thiomonas delicata]OZB45253.1 MAG: hypothetical protein B7X46_05115 [Thiomonas sp. 15-66-11]OZB65951.1 MAG: hypothetical protein B7X31_01040 [Thiomonas sp. 13-66-29]SBP88667.1 conserved hypothetical protein [Thiomonas delicata]
MDIQTFDDLLVLSRRQTKPQHLLFVFVGATLPENASGEQRAEFNAGNGGELEPVMVVDKGPDELADFQTLIEEAARFGPPWSLVFASSVSWHDGLPPTSEETEASLQHMVDSIRNGSFEGMLPFDRNGDPVHLANPGAAKP